MFTLSDDVPGKVVELRSELSAPRDAAGKAREIVIAETLRFVARAVNERRTDRSCRRRPCEYAMRCC